MRTQQTPAPVPRRSLSDKLAVAAGSGAAAAALAWVPTGAQASVMSALGSPISPPAAAGTTNWDVDGDGTVDFALIHSVSSVDYANFDDRAGGRLVVPAAATQDGIAKLASSFMVGPTLASGYKFWTNAQGFNSITSHSHIVGDAFLGGWSVGDTGFFGFKFTSADGTHYGWGVFDITGSPEGSGYSILNAYYESTPDTVIHVGTTSSVPEPSSLALLALGAAGLPALRRRRKTADDAAAR